MLNVTVTKKLRDFTLDIANFNVADGETLALLGENGAGKSTVLRIIAGLLKPEAGRISTNEIVYFDAEAKINLPPEMRNIGYMFQNYALFPHMTAEDNIAYGLKMKNLPATEVKDRVATLCHNMGITDIANQPVTRLSGGQRQRVALARALAPSPDVLLLDEPLAALDVKTQESMRRELSSVIKTAGIPCILVTHSITDALSMANRLSIIEHGKIIDSGTPEDVLRSAKSSFVSSFADNLNLFRGTVIVKHDGIVCVDIAGIKLRTVTALSGEVCVSIRPEELILSKEKIESSAVNSLTGTITAIKNEGLFLHVLVDVGIPLTASVTIQSVERLGLSIGSTVTVTCKATAIQVFI